MEQTLNLNHNAADCLRSVSNFGSTTVMNICNGKATVVPWGSADWALGLFAMLIVLAAVALIGGMAISLIRDL